MATPYLPKTATAEEAAAWLQSQTGESWPLPRLLESGLRPHVWLTPEGMSPDVIDHLFDNRPEGFLAEVCFASDVHRLAADRTGVLSMTKSPRGDLIKFTPPNPFDVSDVRFNASEIRSLAEALRKEAPNSAAHRFVTSPRPLCIPPDLSQLDGSATVMAAFDMGGMSGWDCLTAAQYMAEIQQRIDRQADDLFTVAEAAQVLANERPSQDGKAWVTAMRAAHCTGALAIRDAAQIPFRPARTAENAEIPNTWTATQTLVRNHVDLVKGADVHKWLRETAGYGFPEADSATVTPNQAAKRATPAKVAAIDGCAAFREMAGLMPNEISICIVGDKDSEGFSAKNQLEISAREVTKRVAASELGLIDRRNGKLCAQGAFLLALTTGRTVKSTSANSKSKQRLKEALQKKLGVEGDPFKPYVKATGWVPVFRLKDLRGAADKRAQQRAEYKQPSIDRRGPQSITDADEWMRQEGESWERNADELPDDE